VFLVFVGSLSANAATPSLSDETGKADDGEPTSMKEGTFLVTTAEDEAATLRDVHDQQVITLADNPGIEAGEVLEATVAPEPPLEVAYQITAVESRRTIPVERSEMSPTSMEREMAAEQSEGDVARRERAGEGEIHVLTVPTDRTDQAAADVVDDQTTLERAARLGVERVEVRAADGVVSVRYLPD
jgi:hypothetical protein